MGKIFNNEMIEMNTDVNVDEEVDRGLQQGPNDLIDQRQETPMVLMRAIDTIEEVLDMTNNNVIEAEEEVQPDTTDTSPTMTLYSTRSGRVVKPPQRYGFEEAFTVVKEYYNKKYHEMEYRIPQMTIESVGAMKAILFQNALKQRPKEAMEALREEVQKALKINIWKPILWDHLNEEEKLLVIPMMANYLEKYKPDNTFEKFKVRVLNRSDKQFMTRETEGPVARIESIKMLLAMQRMKISLFLKWT